MNEESRNLTLAKALTLVRADQLAKDDGIPIFDRLREVTLDLTADEKTALALYAEQVWAMHRELPLYEVRVRCGTRTVRGAGRGRRDAPNGGS